MKTKKRFFYLFRLFFNKKIPKFEDSVQGMFSRMFTVFPLPVWLRPRTTGTVNAVNLHSCDAKTKKKAKERESLTGK